MAKKTRARLKWALDYDYLGKLSPEQKAWMEKFNDEYYRSEFSDEPLHNEAQRLSISRANNANERDIFVIHPSKVSQLRDSIPNHRPSIKCRFYFESDYILESVSPEDLLIEFIDENRRAAKSHIKKIPKIIRKLRVVA
jgi:hypothetical protein